MENIIGRFCWGSEQWAEQGRAGQLPFESNPFAGKICCRAWQSGLEGGVEERLVSLVGAIVMNLSWAGAKSPGTQKDLEAQASPHRSASLVN